jgi:hypothetical protein
MEPGAFRDVTHAMFGEEDAREKKISDALQKAFGLDVSVRCAPQWKNPRNGRAIAGQAYSLGGLDLVRLEEGVCDRLAGDINEVFASGSDDWKLLVADDVLTVSHEAAHILYFAPSESTTQCQGYQNAQEVASALGVTSATMAELTHQIPFSHNLNPDEYLTTADCADGGLYDLHPDQVGGLFPQPGRMH